jgi:cytoskeletal protein RodZ
MKGLTLHIVVFILLLALFSMVVLTSSQPDKSTADRISHSINNPDNVSTANSTSAACDRTNYLNGNARAPEFKPESATTPIATHLSRSINDLDKAKPQARTRSARARANDLSEDEVSAEQKDDFVYTDDVVE